MSVSVDKHQADNKFNWVIKNFSSSTLRRIPLYPFFIGGCKWSLQAYPNGIYTSKYFTLHLFVKECKSFQPGWRVQARYNVTIVNQDPAKNLKINGTKISLDEMCGFHSISSTIPLTRVRAKDNGFIVNNDLQIVLEIDVLEVIGKCQLSVSEKETQPPLKKIKREDGADKTQQVMRESSVDVNGFQVLPSQVDIVRTMFEIHPDIALGIRLKNPVLKTAYLNVLLSLCETLHRSLEEISMGDLDDAYDSFGSLLHVGFNVDWLAKELDEVSEKKKKEEACQARIQELEKELMEIRKIKK